MKAGWLRTMPCSHSSSFFVESSAFSGSPAPSPMRAIAHQPCDSMNILPSSFFLEPTGLPKKSYARRYHAPSHP